MSTTPEFTHSLLLDPIGDEVWRGPHGRRLEAWEALGLAPKEGADALAALCGAPRRSDGEWVSHVDLFRTSRELDLVSAEGTARGFVMLPPPGVVLERSVAAFNRAHIEALGAVEMGLPSVYDHDREDIRELTRSYDEDGRIFQLHDQHDDLRLTYAADPHLFNWLRGRQLRADRLPYTIVTSVAVHRRFKRGELGRLNRVRAYMLPDLHCFVALDEAEARCLEMTRLAADATRFWTGEAWVQFVDVTQGLVEERPSLCASLARAAGRPTLVNVLARAPRYYRMRTGLMPDAGTGALLLYNLQWDEENPRRFKFGLDDGRPLAILHGNVAAGSGILCIVLGRALAGLAPRALPVELAEVQVVVQPIADRHVAAAGEHARRLTERGLRVTVAGTDVALGKAMRRHHERWLPCVAVVGDRELHGPLAFQRPGSRERIGEDEFLKTFGERIERCRISAVVRPSPLR